MKERFDGIIEHLLAGNIFLPEAIELLERSMITRALEQHAGNQCAASKQLSIHRNTLQRKMAQYKLGVEKRRRKPVRKEIRSRNRSGRSATA